MTLNLKDFKSNEVNVKVIDQTICVCAEHEEKPDDSGRIYRKITRRYFLPNNVDCDKINATFSDDGNLVVCAGKKAIEAVSNDFKNDTAIYNCVDCVFVGKGTKN